MSRNGGGFSLDFKNGAGTGEIKERLRLLPDGLIVDRFTGEAKGFIFDRDEVERGMKTRGKSFKLFIKRFLYKN